MGLLLRDEQVRTLADMQRYLRRWGAEDRVRFLKQAVGLETFRVRAWLAICRPVLLGAWAMTFLAELGDLDEKWVGQVRQEAFTFGEDLKIAIDLCRGAGSYPNGSI